MHGGDQPGDGADDQQFPQLRYLQLLFSHDHYREHVERKHRTGGERRRHERGKRSDDFAHLRQLNSLVTLAPSFISFTRVGLGTVRICSYQLDRFSMKPSTLAMRSLASAGVCLSSSASSTQARSMVRVGSISRFLRSSMITRNISHRSLSDSK